MSKMKRPEMDSTYLISINEEETVSTLGLTWQPSTDCFKYVFKPWSPGIHMTKRTLLSDINSVFDPIGLLSPALVLGKIFIQHLWTLKINWDTPNDMQSKWTQFYSSLKILEKLLIPRCVPFQDYSTVRLHGFCDASLNAYGACIYIQSTTNFETQLYISKSRVALLKLTTIPRLELCGAILLSELVNTVVKELLNLGITVEPTHITYWTDSTIVLAWINSNKPLNQSSPIQWRHVH